MRYFDGMNKSNGATCPICHTNKDGKIILIPIDETKDGNICEALQVHIDCLDLRIKRDFVMTDSIIYQVIDGIGDKKG